MPPTPGILVLPFFDFKLYVEIPDHSSNSIGGQAQLMATSLTGRMDNYDTIESPLSPIQELDYLSFSFGTTINENILVSIPVR